MQSPLSIAEQLHFLCESYFLLFCKTTSSRILCCAPSIFISRNFSLSAHPISYLMFQSLSCSLNVPSLYLLVSLLNYLLVSLHAIFIANNQLPSVMSLSTDILYVSHKVNILLSQTSLLPPVSLRLSALYRHWFRPESLFGSSIVWGVIFSIKTTETQRTIIVCRICRVPLVNRSGFHFSPTIVWALQFVCS